MIDRGIAAVLIGAVALVACGGQEPETGPGGGRGTARPDSGEPVLRWRMTGGIAGLGGPGSLPDFSLYGDGRAITGPRDGAPPPPLPVQREYRLTPAALQRLLGEARAAGLERSRTIGPDRIADAMVLEIRMGAARTRIVQPESQAGAPAVRFWKRLDPRGWSRADQAEPSRPYRSSRVAVLAGESPAAGGQRVSDWPLKRPLGRGEQAAGALCTVVTGDDRDTAVKHVATADGDHRWRSGGKVYSVRLRPLLPDERTCQDVAKT
ncbi:hypothetical protein [Actinomadura vinacea]|uniref:hypothetical protein n=1 Tax=Actinomadura vinacea TaxID=115336 RepID=UPI0031DD0D06